MSNSGTGKARMPCLRGVVLTLLAWVGAGSVLFAEETGLTPPTLQKLAAGSDLVALAQVTETRYGYTRNFPSSGAAWLRILIPYKTDTRYDRIAVHEQGLKNDECYFPKTAIWEEGQRFLVFLVRDEAEGFRGNPQGCALQVLVTSANRYALRIPQQAIELDPAAQAAVREIEFSDPNARISTGELTRTTIADLTEQLHLRREANTLVYTRGILLSDVRELMGLPLLERSLR